MVEGQDSLKQRPVYLFVEERMPLSAYAYIMTYVNLSANELCSTVPSCQPAWQLLLSSARILLLI